MRFFYVFSAKRIKRSLLVIMAFIFVIGILYVEKESIQVFLPFDSSPTAIYSVKTDKKADCAHI